jgi:hypothetical protein
MSHIAIADLPESRVETVVVVVVVLDYSAARKKAQPWRRCFLSTPPLASQTGGKRRRAPTHTASDSQDGTEKLGSPKQCLLRAAPCKLVHTGQQPLSWPTLVMK